MPYKSKLIEELAELYELSLNIGSSTDPEENAHKFFSSFVQRKNLNHASIWERKERGLVHIASHPKLQSTDINNTESSSSLEELDRLTEDQVNCIDSEDFKLIKIKSFYVWIYFKDNIYTVFTQNDTDDDFTAKEQSQINTLLKKFTISMQACMAYKESLSEITKRKKVENKLFQRESLYRFGANSLSEGIVVVDLNNKITYVNRTMPKLTGYAKDEMLDHIASDVFKPQDSSGKVDPDFFKIGSGKTKESVEIQQEKKDGSKYWVRISTSEFKDAEGKTVGSISSMLDITETYHSRSLIEKSQRELHQLINTMYDGVIMINKNGMIQEANKSARELFEIDESQLGRIKLVDFVHPDDRSDIKPHRDVVMKEGILSNFEAKVLTSSNKTKYLEVTSSAIYEDGKYVGSRDILRDITERKYLEQQRKLSEDKLRLIIDTALDAVVTMDAKGNITEWNKNAEVIFGYSIAEIKGKQLADYIIPEEYREAHAKGMKHYFHTGEGPVLGKRIEIVGLDKSGRIFPIELAITPVIQDGTTSFSAFIRDITLRKEIEAQKEELLGELENVNQELRDFAYVISHDLKAPLRSVKSLTTWLSEDYAANLDEEGQNLVTLIKSRIDKMQGLISGVLEYAKVGKKDAKKEEIPLTEFISEIVELLDPPAHIKINTQPNLPTVSFDKVRLQQVFQNILSNAIKFSDKPNGLIHISCQISEEKYTIMIADNGPGIPSNKLETIFQIFQTVEESDGYESTGVGLSIVKKIIETNGGTISVTSEMGKGCTFNFTIPK